MALGKRFGGGLTALVALGLVLGGCSDASVSKQSSESPVSGEVAQSASAVVKEEVTVEVTKELPLFESVEGAEIATLSPGEYILAEETGTPWILLAERSSESEYPVVLGWINVSEEGSSSYQQSN